MGIIGGLLLLLLLSASAGRNWFVFFSFFFFFLLRIPIAVGLFIWEGKVSGAGLLHKAIRAFFLLH